MGLVRGSRAQPAQPLSPGWARVRTPRPRHCGSAGPRGVGPQQYDASHFPHPLDVAPPRTMPRHGPKHALKAPGSHLRPSLPPRANEFGPEWLLRAEARRARWVPQGPSGYPPPLPPRWFRRHAPSPRGIARRTLSGIGGPRGREAGTATQASVHCAGTGAGLGFEPATSRPYPPLESAPCRPAPRPVRNASRAWYCRWAPPPRPRIPQGHPIRVLVPSCLVHGEVLLFQRSRD